jgi:hypothetical protein
LQEDGVPKDVLEAFKLYLEDAVDDYAYVDVEDFLGHLDFLGLLDKEPELKNLDWKADGLSFGWDDLVEEVENEFDMEPLSGVEEWSVSPREKAALTQPLTDRPDYGTASTLQKMAFRVVRNRVAVSEFVLKGVTNEMREKMNVDLGAGANPAGANSAVFVNKRGNIVVFSDYPVLYDVAKKAKKLGSDALPEIYDVRKFPIEDEEPGTFSFGQSYFYAVEMEHLKTLNSKEENVWEKWQKPVFDPKVDMPTPDSDEESFVSAMMSLKERSERDNVVQGDLWSGNIAWDDKGNMKFIDLEVIDLDGANLAPQSRNSSIV